MRQEETLTDLGKIKVHKNAIASAVHLAAVETEGVKKIADNFKSRFFKMFFVATIFTFVSKMFSMIFSPILMGASISTFASKFIASMILFLGIGLLVLTLTRGR